MDDINKQDNKNNSEKRRSHITKMLSAILIIFVVVFLSIAVVRIDEKNNITRNFLENIFSTEKGQMKKQVKDIIGKLKEYENKNIDRVYEIEDLEKLNIEIPKTPYDREYRSSSYISYIDDKYYACFDDGKNKICGDENKLKYEEVKDQWKQFLLILGYGCNFDLTTKQSKNVAIKELSRRYNEKFIIDDCYIEQNPQEISGNVYAGDCILTVYPRRLGKEASFEVIVNRKLDVGEGYYNLLIKDEYEKNIKDSIDKYFKEYIFKIEYDSLYYFDDNVNKDTLLKDAMNKNLIYTSTTIITKEELNDNDIKAIAEELRELKGNSAIVFIQVSKDTYNSINNEYKGIGIDEEINRKVIFFGNDKVNMRVWWYIWNK